MIIEEAKEIEVNSLEELKEKAVELIVNHPNFNPHIYSARPFAKPRFAIEHTVAMPNGKIKALVKYRFSTGP